jgi:HEAT repeat protein
MHIPSSRTLRDMEIAADLRAQGATWATVALKLNRQPGLLQRWTRVYQQDWERLLKEAEERLSRHANNESRAVLRELLRSKSSKVRLAAAEKLTRLRLKEKAEEPPQNDLYAEVAAFVQAAEEMSDAELEEYLAEFVQRREAAAGALATEGTESTENNIN